MRNSFEMKKCFLFRQRDDGSTFDEMQITSKFQITPFAS